MARLQAFQRHAITAPVFDKTKLHRQRLVQILQDNLWRKLILVVAPAGYGKTTLLADLTAHTDRPVCWVRLTEHDRDAMRLARVVAGSIDSRFPKARLAESLSMVHGVSPGRVGHAMGAAVGTAIRGDFVIVFDDFHVACSSREALEFLLGLAGETPPNLHLVVSSREMPDLPLAIPSARDLVYTITSGDLAVTEEELGELIKVFGASSTPADTLKGLLLDTRGWIAGITLLTLHGLGGQDSGLAVGKDLAFEYFAGEVLNSLPTSEKSALVRSSVLPIMTAGAVEEVLGIEHGAPWLRRLIQKGLFVSVGTNSPRSCEFHPLFREFLLGEFRQALPVSEQKAVMVRAAKHLAANGGESDAIPLYVAAGYTEKAMRVAEKSSGAKLRNGETETLRKWAAIADKCGSPALEVRVALIDSQWAQSSAGAADAIRRTLRRFRKQLSRVDALGLEAYLAWVVSEQSLDGLPGKARAILREVGPNNTSRAGRLAHAVLAWANLITERSLDTAETHARAAFKAARQPGREASIAHMRNLLVWVLLARGKTREAQEIDARFSFEATGWSGFTDAIEPLDRAFWAHRNLQWGKAIGESQDGLANAERMKLEDLVQVGRYVLASVLSDIGADDKALRTLQSVDLARWARYPLWMTDLILTHVQMHRRQGDLDGARAWLKKVRLLPRPYRGNLRVRLESILTHKSLSPEEAASRLDRLASESRERIGPVLIEVLAGFFIALSSWRRGVSSRGLRIARSAIRLAHETGNLAPVCAELAALPKFKAYLQSNLKSEEATRKLWDGISHAQSVLKNLEFEEGRYRTTRSSEVIALGSDSIRVAGTAVHLKPLFAEVLFFVVDKGGVGREELLETFWPDKSVSRQRQGMNAAVYAIRKVLGRDALRVRGDTVVCSEALSKGYDAARFEALAKRIARSRASWGVGLDEAARALSWYGGSFLPGHTRQWVIDRRAELDAVFRGLVAEYATSCIAQGRAADAVQYAARALSYDPLDETSAILVAKIHLAMGRRAHAHQVLAELGVAYKRELGVSPSKEFLAFEDRLLRDNAPQEEASVLASPELRGGLVRSA